VFSHQVNFFPLIKEREIAEKKNMHLRRRLADYKVPNVQEYVEKKADLCELQKTVKSWERKVEIAQVKNVTWLFRQ